MITTMDTKRVDVELDKSFDSKIGVTITSCEKAEQVTIYTDDMTHFMEQVISQLADYDEETLIKTLSDYANLEVK